MRVNDVLKVWLSDGKNDGKSKEYTFKDENPPEKASFIYMWNPSYTGGSIEGYSDLLMACDWEDKESGNDQSSSKIYIYRDGTLYTNDYCDGSDYNSGISGHENIFRIKNGDYGIYTFKVEERDFGGNLTTTESNRYRYNESGFSEITE